MDDCNKKSEELVEEIKVLSSHTNGGGRDRRDGEQGDDSAQNFESELREVFENMPVGMYRTAPDGRILMANPALVRMLGFSSFEELAQRNLEENGFEPDYGRRLFKERVERDGKIVGLESVWTTRQGSRLVIIENARAVRDQEGNTQYYEGTAEDITERKKAEDELRSSQERLKILFESAPDGIYLYDLRGAVVDGNKAAEELVGFTRAELIGKNFADVGLLSKEQMPKAVENLQKNVLGEPTGPDEFTLRRKDGGSVTVEIRTFPVTIDGQALSLGIARDITERKRSEESLKEKEEQLRTVMEASADYIWLVDTELRILYGNRSGPTYSMEDLIGVPIYSLLPEEEQSESKRHLKRALESKSLYRYEIGTHGSDGSQIFFENIAVPMISDGKIVGLTISSRDITERRRAEEALWESEARLKSIFRAAPVGIGLVSDRVLLNVNERVCEMTGYSRDELVGENARILYPTDEDYEYVGREKYGQIRKRGTGTVETRWKHKNGAIIDVLLSSTPLDPDNLSAGVTFTVLDITERKRAEEVLRAEKNKLTAIFEAMVDGAYIVNEQYDIEYVNPVLEKEFGPWQGRKCYAYFHDRKEICPWCKNKDVFAGKTVRWEWYSFKNERTYDLIDTPLQNPDGSVSKLEIFRDITERKEAEEKAREHRNELAHAWRVNTMGEMASGFAHELNQPLCAILNYANACSRIMKSGVDESGKVVEALEQIASQAERAGRIIKRIRGLVAKRKPHVSAVDINGIVREVVEMVRSEARLKNIGMRTELAEDMARVLADSVEIEEVILNLVRNAFEAISDPLLERREVTIRTRAAGGCAVEICVRDTGKGLAGLGERIFDLFFTTKADGLGIGLSISRTIVESYGGRLRGDPNPDGGASFRFTLPLEGA